MGVAKWEVGVAKCVMTSNRTNCLKFTAVKSRSLGNFKAFLSCLSRLLFG